MCYGNICVCKEEECDMINPMSLAGKHVVITGASSGIGRAACVQASKLGALVSLVARNEEKLRETISLMEGDYHKLYSRSPPSEKIYCYNQRKPHSQCLSDF